MLLPSLRNGSLHDKLFFQAAVSTLTCFFKKLKIKMNLKVYVSCPKFWHSGHKCLALPYPCELALESQWRSADPFAPFPYCPAPLLLALRLLTPLLDRVTIPWTVLLLMVVSVSKANSNCQPSLSWFRVLQIVEEKSHVGASDFSTNS